jgi:hypothetical protein
MGALFMSKLDNFFDSRWVNAIGGFIMGGIVVALLKSSPSKPPEPANVDIARADWVTVCVGKMAGSGYPKAEQLKDCTDAALILMPLSPPAPAVNKELALEYKHKEASASNMGPADPETN